MRKFEYKLNFESDSDNIANVLDKITETLKEELVDKITNAMPTITILDK